MGLRLSGIGRCKTSRALPGPLCLLCASAQARNHLIIAAVVAVIIKYFKTCTRRVQSFNYIPPCIIVRGKLELFSLFCTKENEG